MSNIIAVHVAYKDGEVIATQYTDPEQNIGWEHNGNRFSDDEQKQFDAVALGNSDQVTLNGKTCHTQVIVTFC